MTVALVQDRYESEEPAQRYLEDAHLVERACDGDRSAFEELVRRHEKQLEMTARSIVRGADVDDVTQRAWLKIFRKLDSLREPRFFSAWANRITVNSALALIRKRKRLAETGIEALPKSFLTDHGVRGSEELAQWRQLVGKTRTWMRDLDDKDRTIFHHFLVEGMTMDEIAEEVGMSSGGVKVRLFRAREELRGLRDELYAESNVTGRI